MERPFETYQQAIDFLHARINYEADDAGKLTARGLKLDRMRKLLALVGDPHLARPAVHVAGTKGKGSTSVMIAEILSAAGLTVGLFTSPHVDAFEERMTVGGVPPEPAEFVALMNRLAGPIALLDAEDASMRPTYFEIATALGWLYFRDRQTDIDVLEVGLGGRLDSTNVCRPEVTLITNVSRDHTSILGETPAEIAREKAGILKPGVPLITGVDHPAAREVVLRIAEQRRCPVEELHAEIRVEYRRTADGSATVDVQTPQGEHRGVPLILAGKHQATNAALALAAIDRLRASGWELSDDAVHAGMAAVRWPLRLERIAESPTVIVDAAHNEASSAAVCDAIDELSPAGRRILIFAVSREKDVAAMARVLYPRFDEVVLTAFQGNPRSIPPRELRELTAELLQGPVHVAATPAEACGVARSLAGRDDLICATGSFYLAAEVRNVVRAEPPAVVADSQASPELPV